MPARGRAESTVHGFLNLYKPTGMTSMEALRRVKRITGQRRKVGHAGTLDPLAEGVLPICFGQGTRLMEQVVAGRKRYCMAVRLGASSTTYDAEGDIEEVASPAALTRRDIAAALVRFVGTIEQVPPMYSAIKVDGRRLYELARSGKEVERAPRQVEIHAIEIDDIDLPFLRLTVDCGRGTYLRSIAHDLGQALGVGGYVASLSRVSCGQFSAEQGIGLESLEEAAEQGDWTEYLHPVDWALRDCQALQVTREQEAAIKNGQAIRSKYTCVARESETWRAYSPDGIFLALLQFQHGSGCWQPKKVFSSNEASPYAPHTSGDQHPTDWDPEE